MSNVKIVAIHDGLIPEVDPILIELKEKFGKDQVIHFENSNKGLDYVLQNLSQKMIVLLDVNFSKGELSGIKVFDDIRKKTDLVYVILITADELYKIKNDDLVFLINHDAFAIENVTTDYTKIISLVEKAAHQLDVRIASALEQYISSHSDQEKSEPYITSRDGKSYTLSQILEEIRHQTLIGKDVEKKILLLAIDLLARGKKQIDD